MKRSSFVMQPGLALRALAVIIVMLTSTTAWADDSGYCGDPNDHDGQNVTWSYNSSNKTLTISGTGAMNDYGGNTPWLNNMVFINTKTIVIGNGVTSIGSTAFSNFYDLTSVTIPSSVTSIGNGAFTACKALKSVVIPSNVTSIGETAFSNTGLTSITIPSSVTSIGKSVFAGCSKLETITVDAENAKYDSRDGCNAIIETTSKTLIAGCKNTVIPNGVTSIGEYAFNSCSNLTSVVIPSGVTSIGKYAFNSCSNLTSVVIPSGVTSLGDYAFSSCHSLSSLTIPSSVTSIGAYVFYACFGLTSVTIPSRVTSIGKCAFTACSSLTSVVILASNLTTYGDNAFNNNAAGRKIYVPKGSTNDYKTGWSSYSNDYVGFDGDCGDNVVWVLTENDNDNTKKDLTIVGTGAMKDYEWNSFPWYGIREIIKTVVIKNGVTGIGSYAFAYSTSLTSVTIPNSVTSIGEHAFVSCEEMPLVTIPNSVTSIGKCAFFNCASLTSVDIPSSVTSIEKETFKYCFGLTSVTIPNSVTSIGENAFEGCTDLTSVTIPASVTSIKDNPFSYCSALETISVDEGNTIYESGGCNAIIEKDSKKLISGCKSTVIPDGVTSIGVKAFDNCSGLTSITIPSSVESIGSDAFSNCSGLTSVNIPASMTSIENDAFYGCTSLTSITIPASVTSISEDAFSQCTHLTDVYCYADPDRLTWNDNNCDDFIKTPDIKTVCHVAGSKLATFHSKWSKGENTDVNVSFIGDGIEPGGVDYVVEPVTYKSGTAPEGVKAFLPVAYDLSTATVTLAEVTGAPKGMPVIYGSAKVDEKMPNLFFLNYVADDSDADKAIQDNYDSNANAMSDRFVITDGKDNLFTILGDIDGVTASDAIFFVLANGKFTRVNVSADDLDKEANPAKPGLLLFILSKWEYMNMGSNAGGSTNAARGIGISDGGETTRIRPPLTPPTQEGKGCAQWYDMQGRRIEKPTRKGLYIFKGKKVAIK